MIHRAWSWLKAACGCAAFVGRFVGMLIVSLVHDWETDETLSWKVQEKENRE